MNYNDIIFEIKNKFNLNESCLNLKYENEIYIEIDKKNFKDMAMFLHKKFHSPVMSYFAEDLKNIFKIYCVFLSVECKKWFIIHININSLEYPSIAKEIFSANLFEREIKEMFGLIPIGNPDLRRLRLHDEVWPEGYFPLRKDFKVPEQTENANKFYKFDKVEGEGIFEVPVGPVHAGIIGPGHFRFSVAGEPIINLEIRLGFTHKGVEKLFENKNVKDAVFLSECISGDSCFAYSTAFCQAIEKIFDIKISEKVFLIRNIFLELERMYNHINGIGGIAIDVGFSMPNALAAIIKEKILLLNEKLTKSRYLKKVNEIGNINVEMTKENIEILLENIKNIEKDFNDLISILLNDSIFLNRVNNTGILKKKTAEDFGVLGLAGRASDIDLDLRKVFEPFLTNFEKIKYKKGDVFSRLQIRINEFKESIEIIKSISEKNIIGENIAPIFKIQDGFALGFLEAWRGPILFWVRINNQGKIERCKIVDPSFHNWLGLSYCVLGDIIPDFPLCNKSFDLSYSGNDL